MFPNDLNVSQPFWHQQQHLVVTDMHQLLSALVLNTASCSLAQTKTHAISLNARSLNVAISNWAIDVQRGAVLHSSVCVSQQSTNKHSVRPSSVAVVAVCFFAPTAALVSRARHCVTAAAQDSCSAYHGRRASTRGISCRTR